MVLSASLRNIYLFLHFINQDIGSCRSFYHHSVSKNIEQNQSQDKFSEEFDSTRHYSLKICSVTAKMISPVLKY